MRKRSITIMVVECPTEECISYVRVKSIDVGLSPSGYVYNDGIKITTKRCSECRKSNTMTLSNKLWRLV